MKKSDLITTICTGVAFGNILILIYSYLIKKLVYNSYQLKTKIEVNINEKILQYII